MYEIQIKNFEQYNPRKDVTNSTWIRLQHNLFDDKTLSHLSLEEMAMLVWLLCAAGQKQNGKLALSAAALDRRMKVDAFETALRKLIRAGVLSAKVVEEEAQLEGLPELERVSRGTSPSRGRDAENTPPLRENHAGGTLRTNERDVTNETKRVAAPPAPAPSPAPPLPPNYSAFANQFDHDRQEKIQAAAEAIGTLIGRKIEPGFRRRLPQVLDEFGWNLNELADFLATKDSDWSDNSDPVYREVAIKRALGLIAESTGGRQ